MSRIHPAYTQRYADSFEKYFRRAGRYNFLEHAASEDAAFANHIRKRNLPFIESYTVSALTLAECEAFRKNDIPAVQAEMERIPFPEGRYDVVIALDILQRVPNPSRLIHEMMRAARGRLFLTTDRQAFSRKDLKSFLVHERFRATRLELDPVFLSLGSMALPVSISRIFERIPLLKWQCSKVCIYVEYEAISRI